LFITRAPGRNNDHTLAMVEVKMEQAREIRMAYAYMSPSQKSWGGGGHCGQKLEIGMKNKSPVSILSKLIM
jgi:hypothetical protein